VDLSQLEPGAAYWKRTVFIEFLVVTEMFGIAHCPSLKPTAFRRLDFTLSCGGKGSSDAVSGYVAETPTPLSLPYYLW
jgi:hypothetical protein